MTPTAVTLVVCFIGIVVLAVIASMCPSEAKPENENNDSTPEMENSDPLPKTGTLEITQTFEGLDNGIVPEEFILRLFSSNPNYDNHAETICSVLHNWVNGFGLTVNDDRNALFEDIRDENGNICGFKVTLIDLPTGTYYVNASVHEDFKAWVPGYHLNGLKVNDENPRLGLELIPVVIKTNGLTTLSLTEVYEPNRTFTENERVALAEAWRTHTALKGTYLQRIDALRQYLRK